MCYNKNQYFMFYFQTRPGMTSSWLSLRMRSSISKLQGPCRFFSRKQMYLSKLTLVLFSSLDNLCVLCVFIYNSHRSCLPGEITGADVIWVSECLLPVAAQGLSM